MADRLTALGVKHLTKPGRYRDGDGLQLLVRPSGRRSWLLRWTRDGRTHDMGLGSYPAVSLAEARVAAEAARKLIRAGKDPLAARQAYDAARKIATGRTFKTAAAELIADRASGWRNPKHGAQWEATLVAHVYPVIGERPVQDLDTAAVLEVLRPIWERIPETASRVRGRIEAVLDAAKAQGWRSGENPARWRGHLAALLPSPRKVQAVQHQPALPWPQVPAFLAALAARDGIAARALRFAILTAARSGEVRGMTWGEVDLDAAVWTVPARRMKGGRVHRVPLPAAAANVLRGLKPAHAKSAALVFAGTKAGNPLSDMTLTAILRRMNEVEDGQPAPWRDGATGEPIAVHGFRSTFRVWAGEQTAHPRELVEAALAHVLKDKVEAAYARTDLLERRRALMKDWAAFCGG